MVQFVFDYILIFKELLKRLKKLCNSIIGVRLKFAIDNYLVGLG
jgi:hypothetical protein